MINNQHSIRSLSCVLILLVTYLVCAGQHAPRTELSFRNDNDLYLFNKQDQYYTNGIFLSFRRTADSNRLTANETNRLWGITLGQKMYNAYTANIRHIEEVDRSITAYLFLNLTLDRYFANETFLSFSAEAGTIGQQALGRQFQEGIHRAFRLYEIAGWEYQLENAFGVDASVAYGGLLYRHPAKWFDLSGRAQAILGLTHTGMSVSPTLRLGRINRLDQSAYTGSRLQASGKAADREFFFYYSPQVSFVGYDATLQGGMFLRNKGPVTHTPARWLWYNQVGILYARNVLSLRMQYTFYSKEVPGMFFRHRYGSVGAAYRF